jgi:hypothetical protein
MLKSLSVFIAFCLLSFYVHSQCPTCGNGVIDAGETNDNCPQDVPQSATCTSPCGQSSSFESTAGVRTSLDFVGTTTWTTAGLPAGWTFGSAPSSTTASTLAAAGTDAYGAKAGLIQPNCSGSCIATNGFCIGNIASNQAVGAGGVNGKLGANFDGRANVSQNLSYAVLRGQGNPTLVSQSFNMSAVEGFKVQFWLSASETSCGQTNGWGSCVGNAAFLDFSSDGGTSWTQVLTMNTSSTNSDMCTNNSTNTLWLGEGRWGRVCLTVFKTATSPGNFYPAASGTTAASGIMVSNTFFTANFKFRIRYAQTASCTGTVTTTNPGRYLAIDYPVVTSGNEMIPCGISFANMCGYGADNNDDGVGSSSTTTTTVFGTVKRSVNNAERGVEILTSQNSVFASQNLSGSTFATNFDLCNAEGGDKQCIDWNANNNFYTTVYECIADWEAPSGSGINVQYYKGTTAQSTAMTKVTTAGKTALIGWRYSANRIVSCGSTTDLNPGCNGYSFLSGSLPTQFSRGFYALATNNLGQAWSFYGATSCSHYFNGPFFSPIAIPDTSVTSVVSCSSGDAFFTGDVDYCFSSAGFSGSPTLTIVGPNGFNETIAAGAVGTTPIVDAGNYTITASVPTSPAQCLNCGKSICVPISTAQLSGCATLPIDLFNFYLENLSNRIVINWQTLSEHNNAYFEVQKSTDAKEFETIGTVQAAGNSTNLLTYSFVDDDKNGIVYYRLKQVDFDGKYAYSQILSSENATKTVFYPNPSAGSINLSVVNENTTLSIINSFGTVVYQRFYPEKGNYLIDLNDQENGVYWLDVISEGEKTIEQLVLTGHN